MKESKKSELPRSRVKARSKRSFFYLLAIALIATLGSFLFIRYTNTNVSKVLDGKNVSTSTQGLSKTIDFAKDNNRTLPSQQTDSPPQDGTKDFRVNQESNEISSTTITQVENDAFRSHQGNVTSDVPTASNTLSGNKKNIGQSQSEYLINELNSFYAHLDQQAYMRDFHLKEPSKIHFSKLLQLLLDNPPIIAKETDDYFTLLKNTAHFFRILGKENILILKGILDREKKSFENTLKTFYRLTEYPESLKKEYSLVIPSENLYDYAGFFLSTIGGRLYLFRRDSTSRMVISYYAVMIVDRANKKGNSRLGIDLRPAIDSLIDEMENASSNLKLKEEYLDSLYDLKEHYGNRG